MKMLLVILLALLEGTLSYRISDINTEENFDAVVLLKKNTLMKEGELRSLKRNEDVSEDPVSINQGQEIDADIEDGDIMMTELIRDEAAQSKAQSDLTKRNSQRDKRFMWMNKIIPYEIDADLQEHQAVIVDAMGEFNKTTCLRFVPKDDSHLNWIKFVKKNGCWSSVGRQYTTQGPQEISIGVNCEHKNIVIHEILHALGFWHEQSRPDRDKYLEIYWENILEGKAFNFERKQGRVADSLGVDYDYYSIIHYGPKAFSRNGGYTTTAINDPKNSKNIGQTANLTASDILSVNTLYGCSATACSSTVSLHAEHGGSLPSDSFKTLSEHFFSMYHPSNGRLNSGGAWCAKGTNEYLEIDLGEEKHICSVSSQGSNVFGDWVTRYSVRYSHNGMDWSKIEVNGQEKEFVGNVDQQSVVKHTFASPIQSRYVRFYPKQHHSNICMRVGLDGTAPFLSPWSSWAPCNRQTCRKERQRFCSSDNKAVDCPTVNTHGVETHTVSCTRKECTVPINGHWNRWSSWSDCGAACGVGTRIRSRVCDDPPPSFGGDHCVGSNVSSFQCRTKFCGMGPDGCSFTTGLCTWSDSPLADVKWTRLQYSTPSSKTGPSRDHTAVDKTGYYVYLEASNIPTGSKAILMSPVQSSSNGQRCLKFFYHMYDEYNKPGYMGSLYVKMQDATNGTQTILKTISGNQGNQWHGQNLTFTSSNDFIVVFEAVRGTQFVSDIAIDDVYLLWGSCDNSTDVKPRSQSKRTLNTVFDSCDFEDGFCSWFNTPSRKQFDWTRNKGSTATQYTGPSGDHTTRTGYYAYIETSSPRTIGQRARLQSKLFSSEHKCMSLWYHMNGNDVWQLNVIKVTSSNEILLWSANKNERDQWNHGIVPINGVESYTLIIEAVRGHGDQGDIAIDDVVVARQSCDQLQPTTSDPASKASCSFDGNSKQCAWLDLPEGDWYWLSHRGATPNNRHGTGPASDHSGSGFYMYLNSASPRQAGDKALLASPYVSPGESGMCFKFWYHMYGLQVGSLNIYKENLTSPSRTKILSKTKSQGNSWQLGFVHVTGNDVFRIVIEGVVGLQAASDIAIDDVTLSAGAC